MRRNFSLVCLLLASSCALFCCACGESQAPASNAATGTNANTLANTNAAPGAHQGTGAHDTGIGGTSDDGNTNRGVSGNSNVEPAGVNKNAGRTPGTNANSSASNANR